MSRKKGISSLIWDMTNLFSNQIVRFILSIYLARLLEPREFGVVGMAMVYIALTNMIIGFGFGASIINKKDPKQVELSTIFYVNVFFGALLTIIGLIGSPFVGNFYNDKLVGEVFQVLSIIIFIKSLTIVQNSLLHKSIDFKGISIIHIAVNIITAIVGVILAYRGYGVWSLVIMNVLREILYTISIWFYSKWRPLFYFKISSIYEYLKFGRDIFFSTMVNNFSGKLDTLLIGKYTSATYLGYYTRSRSFQTMINDLTGRSVGKVLFPIFSKEEDLSKINSIFWKVYDLVFTTVFFLIGLFYIIGDELFIILFTEKWKASIPIFKILILASFFQPLNILFKSYIKGIGKSKILLRSEFVKSGLLLLTFIPLFWGNVYLFLYLFIAQRILAILFNDRIIFGLNEVGSNELKSIFVFRIKQICITFLAILSASSIQFIGLENTISNLFFEGILFSVFFLILLYNFDKKNFYDKLKLLKNIKSNL